MEASKRSARLFFAAFDQPVCYSKMTDVEHPRRYHRITVNDGYSVCYPDPNKDVLGNRSIHAMGNEASILYGWTKIPLRVKKSNPRETLFVCFVYVKEKKSMQPHAGKGGSERKDTCGKPCAVPACPWYMESSHGVCGMIEEEMCTVKAGFRESLLRRWNRLAKALRVLSGVENSSMLFRELALQKRWRSDGWHVVEVARNEVA